KMPPRRCVTTCPTVRLHPPRLLALLPVDDVLVVLTARANRTPRAAAQDRVSAVSVLSSDRVPILLLLRFTVCSVVTSGDNSPPGLHAVPPVVKVWELERAMGQLLLACFAATRHSNIVCAVSCGGTKVVPLAVPTGPLVQAPEPVAPR